MILLNPLTPNDLYSGRTAPLTSKRCILYIYSTNIDTEYLKLEKKLEYNEEVHQLFINFKKVYDSVRTEILYKIHIEFGIPKKLIMLIR